MAFQIGDMAVLKHSELECKIVGKENAEMYKINIKGKEYLVYIENLETAIFDWQEDFRTKKKNLKFNTKEQLPIEKQEYHKPIAPGKFIALYPKYCNAKNIEIESFIIYFINNDKLPYSLNYQCVIQGKQQVRIKEEVLPYTNLRLQNISMDDMHLIPQFNFGQTNESNSDEKLSIKIKPKKFFEYIQNLLEGKSTHILINLEGSFQQNLDNEDSIVSLGTNSISNQTNNPYNVPKYVREVDLHIEKIKPDFQHLTNAEIIQIQLNTFENALQAAIQTGQADITFIHGVGKGVLKEQLHQILKAEFYVRHYICEWSPKYGYGATQVFFNV